MSKFSIVVKALSIDDLELELVDFLKRRTCGMMPTPAYDVYIFMNTDTFNELTKLEDQCKSRSKYNDDGLALYSYYIYLPRDEYNWKRCAECRIFINNDLSYGEIELR